ncbi:hypothetical protein [Streptomyces sp. NPDC015680]
MKYAVSALQTNSLREIATAPDAVRVLPAPTHAAWALKQRGLIKMP